MTSRTLGGLLAFGAAIALSGCAYDSAGYSYDQSYPSYYGGQYGASGIGGTGAQYLDPWLSGTEVGRMLVLRRFDKNYSGTIRETTARQANAWFRRYADTNRDLVLTDQEIDAGLQRLAGESRYY